MWTKCEFLWLIAFTIDVCVGQSEKVNGTSTFLSREIVEKQALRAYENACFGLQELANWMSVVFKMKSVWASSTISQMDENSRGAHDKNQRKFSPLPQRPRAGPECSLQSLQVTIKTYVHLQGELLHLKGILGRNMMKTSNVKLASVNATLRERIKVLDVFNETLNNVFSKLRQNTQKMSSVISSENKNWRNLISEIQEGRALQYFQMPINISQTGIVKEEIGSSGRAQSENKGFFQTAGKALDKIIFPTKISSSRTKISNIEGAANVNIRDTEINVKSGNIEENFDAEKMKLMKEQTD